MLEEQHKPRRPSKSGKPPETVECFDPATNKKLGEVPVQGRAAVEAIVERGRKAQKAWARTTWKQRRAVLRDVLQHVVANQEEICRLAALDSGKTMVDAVMGEIFPVCEKLRYTIANGERDLATQARSPGFLVHKKARVEYHPYGVIAVICPWNFPFHNLFCPVIPALFAGNAVVAKVSEWSSWSAADYVAIWQDALARNGHSRDLVQVVTGLGETGAHLVSSGVDKVFFTGSPATGKKVMENASANLTPVVLELGGKDPMIVCEDAKLSQVADAAMLGVFTACGQMCVGIERVYVYDGIYDDFVREMTDRIKALRQGPPLSGELVDVGATTMPLQLEKIQGLVDDAVVKGARLLTGGRRNEALEGQYYRPTLLADVDHGMRIAQEECFGPVVTVIRVHDDDHLMQLINDVDYGLGSSVFTKDPERANAIASKIRAGMTVVNDYGIAYMVQALPFGGVGISGFGRINGREGLRACCYEHAVVTDRVPIGKSFGVHPVQPNTYELVESAVRVIYGGGIRQRARGAVDTARHLVSLALRRKD
jgi:acyl-CoA reductase-like NAD-dependent aldehyde dehydrogenase